MTYVNNLLKELEENGVGLLKLRNSRKIVLVAPLLHGSCVLCTGIHFNMLATAHAHESSF